MDLVDVVLPSTGYAHNYVGHVTLEDQLSLSSLHENLRRNHDTCTYI